MPTVADLQKQILEFQKTFKEFASNAPSKDNLKCLASKEDISNLDTKITANYEQLNAKINNVEQSVITCRNDIKANTKTMENHESRLTVLEAQLKYEITNIRKKNVLKDMYDRRRNLLILGIEEKNYEWDETPAQSEELIREVLTQMKVEGMDCLVIEDCHRLPSNRRKPEKKDPKLSENPGNMKPRPIIFKLTNMLDVRKILDCGKSLKEINKGRAVGQKLRLKNICRKNL